MIGWEKCPRVLIRDRRVSSKAVRLFLLLKTFSGPGGCFPSQQELAASLDDCAEKTVRRCLDELRSAGYIQTRRKWIETPSGPRQTCEYIFVDASKVNGHQSPLTADSERTPVSLHSNERTPMSAQIESERTFGAILNGHDGPRNCDLGTETYIRSSEDEREHGEFALEAKPKTKTPALKSRAKTQALGASQERWFSEFWGLFWIKAGKRDAERAFQRVVTSEEVFAAVMAGVRRQRDAMLERASRGEPVKYAQGWLNGRRWEDEPPVRQFAPEREPEAARAASSPIDWSEA